MKKIVVYYLKRNPKISKTDIQNLISKIENKGYEISLLTDGKTLDLSTHDMMVTMGGDGTILRAAMLASQYNLPLLGISKGNLGFLAEVTTGDIAAAIDKYVAKRFFFDKRHLLQMKIGNDQNLALNEVAIKSSSMKMIELEVYLNDLYLTTYKADGLILSTSTGSTAYNLSAGGPIIFPDAKAIVITPICSHSLTVRSLVVSSDNTIKIVPKEKNINISIDGNEPIPSCNEEINVSYSTEFINFIRFNKHSFIDGLRNKLNWSGKL